MDCLFKVINSVKGKGKAIDFTSPRTSSGQVGWPYETGLKAAVHVAFIKQ